jgi:3-deoxy-D-manno-octulosonate 8-phosphate phosphatase (KDO 8-P phosphatase)
MLDVIRRLRKIKMLALDVDGVLTDSTMFLDGTGEWRRSFSLRDGYGVQLLSQQGYKTAFITASKALDIQERARVLKIDYFHHGNLDKKSELAQLVKVSGVEPHEIAYMGDDLFDIPVLQSVGFAATVPEAVDQVFHYVHYVTKKPGGNGAVREVCELLLRYGPLGGTS